MLPEFHVLPGEVGRYAFSSDELPTSGPLEIVVLELFPLDPPEGGWFTSLP